MADPAKITEEKPLVGVEIPAMGTVSVKPEQENCDWVSTC